MSSSRVTEVQQPVCLPPTNPSFATTEWPVIASRILAGASLRALRPHPR
ncbi:hypothetical protein [Streptomyces sp. NPDC051109]